jgi:hypothetical protein
MMNLLEIRKDTVRDGVQLLLIANSSSLRHKEHKRQDKSHKMLFQIIQLSRLLLNAMYWLIQRTAPRQV